MHVVWTQALHRSRVMGYAGDARHHAVHRQEASMLSLALPKGSLEEQTMLLFNQADMTIGKSSRAYNPTVDEIGRAHV